MNFNHLRHDDEPVRTDCLDRMLNSYAVTTGVDCRQCSTQTAAPATVRRSSHPVTTLYGVGYLGPKITALRSNHVYARQHQPDSGYASGSLFPPSIQFLHPQIGRAS